MSERRVLRGKIVERRTSPRSLVESPEELAAMLAEAWGECDNDDVTYVHFVPAPDDDVPGW